MTDRQRILGAFGVTENDLEEFAELDAATEAAHHEKREFFEEALARLDDAAAQASKLLPLGLRAQRGELGREQAE